MAQGDRLAGGGRTNLQKSPSPPTDETDETHLLAVSSVTPQGVFQKTQAVNSASNDAAPSERASAAPEFTALVTWTDADIERYRSRRARLIRWGWSEPEAEKLADRLVKRDRDANERVSCTDCRNYRPGRCGNFKAAGLHSPELGRDLAGLLQRCPAFQDATP